MRSATRSPSLTQPALTRSLQELDAKLDIGLFERYAHGVALTAAGERFLVRAPAALEEAAQTTGNMQGSVTVTLPSAVGSAMLPTACGAFRRESPEVRPPVIESLFPAADSRLRDGRLDFYMGPQA